MRDGLQPEERRSVLVTDRYNNHTQFPSTMFSLQLLFGLLLSFTSIHAYPYQLVLSEKHSFNDSSLIHDILKSNEIIPDVLDDFEPSYGVLVQYTGSKNHPGKEVHYGNDLPVKSVSKRPRIEIMALDLAIPALTENEKIVATYQKPEHSKTYTLILTDPDALSRSHPVKSEMCHWILTNITTTTTTTSSTKSFEIDIDSSDLDFGLLDPMLLTKKHKNHKGELESYYPPAPPPKTGPHRYVFVLLEGSGGKHGITKPKERPHWGYGKQRHGVRDWAEENNLKVVGANFFFAQNKKQ